MAVATMMARPSFLGLMRSEWLKITRQWTFWIMVALMFGGYAFFFAIVSQGRDLTNRLAHNQLVSVAAIAQGELFLLRVFWGMMLIILTARLIGMEYSSGVVRVILARGVGRLQLLFAQLSVMALIALFGSVLYIAFASLAGLLMVQLVAGNVNVFNAADATFWADTGKYAAAVLISLGVSILLAAAVTAVTRSLAAGLTVSVIWFPIDNFAVVILLLSSILTHWGFWSLASGDFLGLNLNAMGAALMSAHTPATINGAPPPLVPVTGAHTLLIAAIYTVIFLAVTVGVTAWKDVQE
jgi:ABC-type transport system involved in multi-copper enzyme maturation permease subunit